MKLQPDKSSAPLVRAYSHDWLQIDDQRFAQSVIVSSLPEHPPRTWAPRSLDELARQVALLWASWALPAAPHA